MNSVTECLQYLAETDEKFGQLKASVKYFAEYETKRVKALAFVEAEGKTIPLKEANSMLDERVSKVYLEKEEVETEMEIMAAKRKTAELRIDVWRSQNANKRAGNF